MRGYLVEHFAGRRPGCHPLRIGGKRLHVGVPTLGQFAPLDHLQLGSLLGIFGLVAVEQRGPLGEKLLAASADPVGEMFPHLIGHEELLVFRPAVGRLGQLDFFVAQRRAVRVVAACLVRRAESDFASGDNHRRPAGDELLAEVVECNVLDRVRPGGWDRPSANRPRLAEHADGMPQRVECVDVGNANHVPAVTGESGGYLFAKAEPGVALDGDAVVVVNPAEVRQFQVSGQRCGLAADAFHQITVAAQSVHVEVEQVEAGAIVPRGQPSRCGGHANAVGNSLSEWAGGRFDARGLAIFWGGRGNGCPTGESCAGDRAGQPARRLDGRRRPVASHPTDARRRRAAPRNVRRKGRSGRGLASRVGPDRSVMPR